MSVLSKEERRQLWLRMGLRLGLTLLVLAGLYLLGPTLWSLFAPFLVAIPIAWILSPAVRWLNSKLGGSQKIWTALLLLGVFALLGCMVWGLTASAIREIGALAGNWSSLVESLQTSLERLRGTLSQATHGLPDSARSTSDQLTGQLFTWLQTAIPRLLSATLDRATDMVRALPSFLVAAIVFILAAYFLTSDYTRIRAILADRLPQGTRFLFSMVKRAASTGIGGYLRAQLILSCGVFCILLIGFLVIGQDYTLLLAFGLAVLDFIPILGAGTVLVPWIVVDLFAGSFRHALSLSAIWGLVSVFRRVGEPKILGDQTGLPPILSLMSIYAGMRLAGVLGMILSPILCLVVVDLYRAGMLEGTLSDIRLACRDVAGILSHRGEET